MSEEEIRLDQTKMELSKIPVDQQTLLDSLSMTYEKAVNDNTEDFMCLSEMIITLVSLLKAKGILTEEEAQVIYDIPSKKLEEKK